MADQAQTNAAPQVEQKAKPVAKPQAPAAPSIAGTAPGFNPGPTARVEKVGTLTVTHR